MGESHPSRRGARAVDSAPQVDVSEMPRVLQRISALALRYPVRLGLAVACSVGAALATLALPRLFGAGVDHAGALLKAGAAQTAEAQSALMGVAMLVIAATVVRISSPRFGGACSADSVASRSALTRIDGPARS